MHRGAHGRETLKTYAAHLEAGRSYRIRLEYFEAIGSATYVIIPTTLPPI